MMKTLQLTMVIILVPLTTSSFADEANWQVGIASRVITPAEPMWMGGYASRKEPSQGKLHDLYAKAIALQDKNGNRAVLVATDLVSVTREILEPVEQRVEQELGLKPHDIVVNVSHTHCGPEIRSSKLDIYDLSEEESQKVRNYQSVLQQHFFEVIRLALADLKPAKLGYTHGQAGFAMNRRLPQGTQFINRPYADGPVDHDVPVLVIRTPEDELRGLVFGYACHNTTLGIQKFNGDYAGFAQEYLEAAHPNVTALFVAGCGGDQNPQPRRTIDLAQQHGRALANAVEAAILSPTEPVVSHLRTAQETVTLEFAKPPTQAEIIEQTKSKNKYVRRHAQHLLDVIAEKGQLQRDYPYPVHVWRLGENILFAALAGEVVVDYSLRLKSELAGPRIWIAGYCNDVMGYIPSRRVLLEGGYEGGGAMVYMPMTGPWAPSVEKLIVAAVHRLAEKTNVKLESENEELYTAKPFTPKNSFTAGIEGPGVDRYGNIYAVNYQTQQTIGRVTPNGDADVFVILPENSVGNGIRFDMQGMLFVADYVNHNILKIDPATRKVEIHAHNEQMNQPNDIVMATDGTIYASDPNWGNGSGQIWRVDTDGSTTRLAQDIGTTNGIEISPDGNTLYVNESVQRQVWAYPFKPDRTLGQRKLIAEFSEHALDGMRCDIDGNLYVTRHGAGVVAKISPSGELLNEIDVLGTMPSNITFGGPDGRTAYVTEVEHARLVSFRVEEPGFTWKHLYGEK